MGVTKSGWDELDADLANAVRMAVPETKKVVGKGCLEIKRTAKKIIKAASHHGYLPHYPKAITYEVETSGMVVRGEVGAVTERAQGTLSRVLEYGGIHSAPIPHMSPAADLQEGVFYAHMEQIGIDLLEGVESRGGGPVVDPE